MSIKNHKNLQEKPDRATMFWRECSLPDKNVCCSAMVGLRCQEIPQKVLSTLTIIFITTVLCRRLSDFQSTCNFLKEYKNRSYDKTFCDIPWHPRHIVALDDSTFHGRRANTTTEPVISTVEKHLLTFSYRFLHPN